MTGRSSGIGASRGPPGAIGLRRQGEPDPERDVRERLRRGPGTGEGAESGAAAGDDGPVIAGDDLETQSAAEADQGLEGAGIQAGQMERRAERCPPAEAPAETVLPPVGAERVAHRPRGVERQRRDIHAPAGSAGGAPRMGARAGVGARLARGRVGGRRRIGGGRFRGGSGQVLAPGGRDPRDRSSRARAAPARCGRAARGCR